MVLLREPSEDTRDGFQRLHIPCSTCLGCRKARALEWAHRCWLESHIHDQTAWVTLTYDDEHLPATGLSKDSLSAWLKRVRSSVYPTQVRFFASGEYGEQTQRAHYHAIIYGLPPDAPALQDKWGNGHVKVDSLTPARIAYTAGYVAKKIGWHSQFPFFVGEYETLDRDTGEVVAGRHKNYMKEPPFVLMSRKPGIGAHARKHWLSWRRQAVYQGRTIPVPRFLHQAYQDNASAWDLFNLDQEKWEHTIKNPTTKQSRLAAEKHAVTLSNLSNRNQL